MLVLELLDVLTPLLVAELLLSVPLELLLDADDELLESELLDDEEPDPESAVLFDIVDEELDD